MDLLESLIDVLKINSKFQSNTKNINDGKLEIKSWYFSDSFVFVMKSSKNNQNLSQLFLIIRFLQDRFWENGFCFRGAITLGEMYYPDKDENVLLGNGIVEAYKLECEVAIYPRIVVDEKVYEIIKEEDLQGYPFGSRETKLKDSIKKDKDGVYFLDLLNKNILRPKNEKIESNSKYFSIVWCKEKENESNLSYIRKKVNKIINENSQQYNHNLKIKQKYEWLKAYLKETKV